MNIQQLLTKALIGGAIGAGAGFGHKAYTGSKTYGSPILGAEIGAGLGALLEALRQNKEEKNKNVKTREKLEPGLYYMERGIWGNKTFLKGTAFHQNARHGFYVGVYNEKPEGIETQKLPNGQYVVTFGGYPSPKKGSGIGDLYIAVNGKSNINGIDSPNDFRAIKSLFDSDLQRNSDYAATITPVDLNPASSDETLRKMYALARQYENTSFGQYHTGLFGPANNCLTVLGSLTNSMGRNIDINKLPQQFGNLGGFTRQDIRNFKTLQELHKPTPRPNTPLVVTACHNNFKKAARYILYKRMVKRAGITDTLKSWGDTAKDYYQAFKDSYDPVGYWKPKVESAKKAIEPAIEPVRQYVQGFAENYKPVDYWRGVVGEGQNMAAKAILPPLAKFTGGEWSKPVSEFLQPLKDNVKGHPLNTLLDSSLKQIPGAGIIRANYQRYPYYGTIEPGLYYAEHGVLPFGPAGSTIAPRLGRHGFLTAVYNEKPEGFETQKLKNGQYVVTFATDPTMKPAPILDKLGINWDLPDGGNYVSLNGNNGYRQGKSDYESLNFLVNPWDYIENMHYATSLHPLSKDPEEVSTAVNKLLEVMKLNKKIPLDAYNGWALMGKPGTNCLVGSAFLLNASGIPRERWPRALGGYSAFKNKDIIANQANLGYTSQAQKDNPNLPQPLFTANYGTEQGQVYSAPKPVPSAYDPTLATSSH